MKFDDLVKYVLKEAKKGQDPLKYTATGPAKFRKDTGFSNPEKFVPDSPSRKMYDPASVDKSKRAKSGEYIETNIHDMIKIALLVTVIDPQAGAELKRVLEEFAKPYQDYQGYNHQYKTLLKKLERASGSATVSQKFRSKEDAERKFRGLKMGSDKQQKYIDWLEGEINAYEKLTGEAKAKCAELVDDVLDSVQDLVREGGKAFVSKLNDQQKKDLEQGESEDYDAVTKQAMKYLEDVWKGKSGFEPLLKFAEVEKNNNKNPIPRLLTIYKTVIDTAAKNNLVGSADRTLNYITGKAKKIKTIVEPTKSKTVMKQKDPWLLKTIDLIKKQKYATAKQTVNATRLDNQQKVQLMNNIEKLSRGEMTEADVVRPLYSL